MRSITFFIIISLFFIGSILAEKKSYTFGIVPQQAARTLAKKWAPILKLVSDRSGITLRFSTAKDIPTFEKRLREGKYDFAYMNPYHYVVFSESPGYRAMAKQRDKSIQGIIVVRKDSHIKSIEDLKECTLAFPAPAAFAASILPRSYFLKNNFNITPKYVSSHDSVYRNVASGKLIAGGGVKRTFATVDQNVSSQLRILWTTDRYTPHAFAYHPSIDKKVIAAIQKSFLSLEDTDGMKRLNEINFKGVQAALHEDWNDVRALPINIIQ